MRAAECVSSRGWWDGHHCEGLCPSRSPGYLIQNDVGLVEWVRGKSQRKQCLECPRQCRSSIRRWSILRVSDKEVTDVRSAG